MTNFPFGDDSIMHKCTHTAVYGEFGRIAVIVVRISCQTVCTSCISLLYLLPQARMEVSSKGVRG